MIYAHYSGVIRPGSSLPDLRTTLWVQRVMLVLKLTTLESEKL